MYQYISSRTLLHHVHYFTMMCLIACFWKPKCDDEFADFIAIVCKEDITISSKLKKDVANVSRESERIGQIIIKKDIASCAKDIYLHKTEIDRVLRFYANAMTSSQHATMEMNSSIAMSWLVDSNQATFSSGKIDV